MLTRLSSSAGEMRCDLVSVTDDLAVALLYAAGGDGRSKQKTLRPRSDRVGFDVGTPCPNVFANAPRREVEFRLAVHRLQDQHLDFQSRI